VKLFRSGSQDFCTPPHDRKCSTMNVFTLANFLLSESRNAGRLARASAHTRVLFGSCSSFWQGQRVGRARGSGEGEKEEEKEEEKARTRWCSRKQSQPPTLQLQRDRQMGAN
jgi:hypothetical protein